MQRGGQAGQPAGGCSIPSLAALLISADGAMEHAVAKPKRSLAPDGAPPNLGWNDDPKQKDEPWTSEQLEAFQLSAKCDREQTLTDLAGRRSEKGPKVEHKSRSSSANGKRGGKRPGAGRPPKGAPEIRLAIGLEVDVELRVAVEKQRKRAIDSLLGRKRVNGGSVDLFEKWRLLQSIPVNERHQWLLKEEVEGEFLDDTRDNIAALISSYEPDRLKRPYGFAQESISIVAKRWSEKLGREVTRRFVKTCHNEYRSIIKRLSEAEPVV